jgi:lipopolysaccharide/colanic/teichoic acid biosynthesis glycosyltransferase
MSSFYSTYGKRVFDLLLGIPGLLIALPFMVIIPVLLLLTGHPRIFFTQKRVGYREKIFTLLKFCSMKETRDAAGQLLPDKERLTAFGKFLRKTSLDELPQLINVISGSMSLVGPRPLLIEYLPRYTQEQRRRHLVRPGITGWAQVSGRNDISWSKKFEKDIYYVDHLSFGLDLKILLLTVKKTLQAEGISLQGHATTEPFTGAEN